MEQRCPCLLRLWIIEHAWAHNAMDVFQAVDVALWPEVAWEPLSLDESWRVRVLSAQVYCIVRKRQTSHYERVLVFLEHTHSLLPTLVPSIKHMKIMFGLKTMVVLWMLKEGMGPVGVVQKIIRFFPSKLPQYQEHCSKHEMFLMRKSQLDFKAFAQSLVMDKQKLQNYIRDHMEEQYGEHYAQKTEERLLHYLRKLDKALPKDTYIDKILKKNSPAKEEEKLLLGLITDDSIPIATTLKTLLGCDSAFCYSLGTSMGNYENKEFPVCAGSSKNHLKTTAEKSSTDLMAVRQVDPPDVVKVSDTVMNDGNGPRNEQAVGLQTDNLKHERRNEATSASEKEKSNKAMGEISSKSSVHEGKLSPRFCSKHQRWVRNILCECPGESSEEQQAQDSEISPPLFTSTSSSSDLTPSNLTPPPDHHQSSSNSNELQEIIEDTKVTDKAISVPVNVGPPSYPAPPAVQTSISGGAVLKVVVVPFKDLTPVCPFKISTTSQTDLPMCSNQDSATASFSHLSISKKSSVHQTQTASATSSKPSVSRLSRKLRLGKKYSHLQDAGIQKNENKRPQKSPALLDNAANLSVYITSVVVSSNNTPTITSAHFLSQAASNPTVTWSTPDHVTKSEGNGALRGSHMQPRVALKRMSVEECLQVTSRRSHPRKSDAMEHSSDSADSSFDVNSLYSGSSSEEEVDNSDTEYRPHRKTLRKWALADMTTEHN